MIQYRKAINIIHILVVAPLLYALATNRIPEEYKKYIILLALLVAIFHSYRFITNDEEGYEQIYGSNVHQIKIFDSSPGYDKPMLTIKKGDLVVWTNIGEVEHTITSENEHFNSGYLKPGDNYTVKFDHPGEYHYYCMYHKGWMQGIIIVQ